MKISNKTNKNLFFSQINLTFSIEKEKLGQNTNSVSCDMIHVSEIYQEILHKKHKVNEIGRQRSNLV